MVQIERVQPPLLQGGEVTLSGVIYPDEVKAGDAFKVQFAFHQSPYFLGGLPTDPNYCSHFGNSGRKVRVEAWIDRNELTAKENCVYDRNSLGNYIHEMDVPTQGFEAGQHELFLKFRMADTRDPQFGSDSYNTDRKSAFQAPLTIGTTNTPNDPNDGGQGGCETDNECAQGEVCRNGLCVQEDAPPGDNGRRTLAIALVAGGVGLTLLNRKRDS